jgi:hypothetical protein
VLDEIEKRTGRAVADCFDMIANANNGNVENLKTEVGKLIQAHRAEMETVCVLLQERWGEFSRNGPVLTSTDGCWFLCGKSKTENTKSSCLNT